MADRHGGVGVGAALGEHQRNRFTDDFAAAQHHHVATGGFDVVVHQQLLNPLGRAGQEPRPALDEQADIFWMKRVDIFQRMDGIENALFLDLLRQWKLHENAVHRINGRGVVQSHDQIEQFLLRRRSRQTVQPARHADALASLPLVAHIDLAGRVFAHQHRGQAGRDSALQFELSHARGQIALQSNCKCFAIQDCCRHGFCFPTRWRGATHKKSRE